MRDDVTVVAMAGLLRRLCASFGKPFGTTAEAMVQEYAGAFRRAGIPLVAAERAVDEAISTGKRFPPVSELLDRARPFVPRSDGERNHGPVEGCPHCGMMPFYAGYELSPMPATRSFEGRPGGVLPRVRCGCPSDDPAWSTEAALAWVEPQPGEHRDRLRPHDYLTNERYHKRQRRSATGAAGFTRAV